MRCPKCDADISDTQEEYDPTVGITSGGWYCEACDLAIADWEVDDDYEAGHQYVIDGS